MHGLGGLATALLGWLWAQTAMPSPSHRQHTAGTLYTLFLQPTHPLCPRSLPCPPGLAPSVSPDAGEGCGLMGVEAGGAPRGGLA